MWCCIGLPRCLRRIFQLWHGSKIHSLLWCTSVMRSSRPRLYSTDVSRVLHAVEDRPYSLAWRRRRHPEACCQIWLRTLVATCCPNVPQPDILSRYDCRRPSTSDPVRWLCSREGVVGRRHRGHMAVAEGSYVGSGSAAGSPAAIGIGFSGGGRSRMPISGYRPGGPAAGGS